MSKAHEYGQKVQGQTLDAVRKAQDAVVEVVTAWTESTNKIPGFTNLTNQFPDASDFIDANFDFALQLLSTQRDFAARIMSATAPEAPAPAAVKKAMSATAPEAPAPAAVKKAAPQKTTAAAKKSSAVRSAGSAK